MNETVASIATTPGINQGMLIPWFTPGRSRPSPFSSADMNKIVAVCNAVLNGKIVRGSTDALVISARNAVFQISRATSQGGSQGNDSMFPFRVYQPDGEPSNTFRIHGGVALVPELFPANTTPRTISIDRASKYQECAGTDLVFDSSSDSQGSDVNDIVLDNWDRGDGSFYISCGIWLEVSQRLDSPGTVLTQIVTGFDFLPSYCIKRIDPDIPELLTVLMVPIAKIIPTSIDTDPLNYGDLLSSITVQFQREQAVWPIQFGRYAGTYNSGRVCLPNESVFASDGNFWMNMAPYAIIGSDPILASEFIRINQ